MASDSNYMAYDFEPELKGGMFVIDDVFVPSPEYANTSFEHEHDDRDHDHDHHHENHDHSLDGSRSPSMRAPGHLDLSSSGSQRHLKSSYSSLVDINLHPISRKDSSSAIHHNSNLLHSNAESIDGDHHAPGHESHDSTTDENGNQLPSGVNFHEGFVLLNRSHRTASRNSADWEFIHQLKFAGDYSETHSYIHRDFSSSTNSLHRLPSIHRIPHASLHGHHSSHVPSRPNTVPPSPVNTPPEGMTPDPIRRITSRLESVADMHEHLQAVDESPESPIQIDMIDDIIVPDDQKRDKIPNFKSKHEREDWWVTHKFGVLVVSLFLYAMLGSLFYVENEGWSFLEGLYFMASFFSTVGYGDFHPTSQTTRGFTIVYGFFGLLILTYIVAVKLKEVYYKEKLAMRRAQVIGIFVCMGLHVSWQTRKLSDMLVRSLLPVFLLTLACVVFTVYHLGYTVVDGLYFTLISMSTVGFGDISPGINSKGENTTFGKYFAIVLIILVIASNLNFHGETWIYKVNSRYKREFKSMLKGLDEKLLDTMNLDIDDPHSQVDLAHWMAGILAHNNVISPHVLEQMFLRFRELDTQNKGYLTTQQIRDSIYDAHTLLDITSKPSLIETYMPLVLGGCAAHKGEVKAWRDDLYTKAIPREDSTTTRPRDSNSGFPLAHDGPLHIQHTENPKNGTTIEMTTIVVPDLGHHHSVSVELPHPRESMA